MNFIILFRISEQKKEREKTVGRRSVLNESMYVLPLIIILFKSGIHTFVC